MTILKKIKKNKKIFFEIIFFSLLGFEPMTSLFIYLKRRKKRKRKEKENEEKKEKKIIMYRIL